MRKNAIMLMALIAMSLKVYAQGMTATLQRGDNLTAFYGIDAFKEAYNAAKDGDQITLSSGTFNSLGDETTITKSIKITGAGAFGESNTAFSDAIIVTGKDVRIEGILMNSIDVSGSSDLYVTRCWINTFKSNSNFTGAIFNESVFNHNMGGLVNADNYTIKNCTINSFGLGAIDYPKTNFGNITNCVIYDFTSQPYAIYKNNVIGYHFGEYIDRAPYVIQGTFTWESPNEFYSNSFFAIREQLSGRVFDVKLDVNCLNNGNGSCSGINTDAYPANKTPEYGNFPNGDDGTPVGIYGGTGFSPYPAIPRILNKIIDAYTNDEGKINVKIEVKSEK